MLIKLLYFSAPWSLACKKARPVADNWYNKNRGQGFSINFEYIDMDQRPLAAENMKIKAAPTLIFLANGIEIGRVVGRDGITRANLNMFLMKALGPTTYIIED